MFSIKDNAASDSFGVILMVAVTILLAFLVLLMFNIQPFGWNMEKEIPEIFTITGIESTDEITGHLNFDSRVILLHTGEVSYQNKNLTAKFFKNEQPVPCSITTMNGHDFINTTHWGVQWMGGSGCSEETWNPGERIRIDFTDGTFLPGDRVQVDILDKNRNAIISRHVFKV
ncbi:MAG: type IV pilin [Methanoregula sp.]